MPKSSIIFHGMGSVTNKAMRCLLDKHYLGRKPPMSDTFEWWLGDDVVGVLTTGVPASRHMQLGALPDDPNSVVELNRLWVSDDQPHGTASWFVARCMDKMPPRIVLSYADTTQGHDGGVYRACNFFYAGWTDMDRKTPRFDYLVPGKHSRDAFRSGDRTNAEKVRRCPKVKYWTATGSKKERRELGRRCLWPKLCWKVLPPPTEHRQHAL